MRTRSLWQAVALRLPLAAPLALALALTGCDGGSSEKTETNAPSDAVKASESSYEAEIAKNKAATPGKGTPGKAAPK